MALDIDRVFPRSLLPLGNLLTPPLDMQRMTNPRKDGFKVVADPVRSGWRAIENINPSGLSDGHVTIGSGRTLDKGEDSTVALEWLYAKPADLVQTARNLILQLQMLVSPIFAISTLSGKVQLVTRDGGGSELRWDLGPIPWGHWFTSVVRTKLADKPGGIIECWYAVDGIPDVSKPPTKARSGIQTWQGKTGHHTIGQYSKHSKPGLYRGYIGRFGRGNDPADAIANMKLAKVA